MIKILIGLLLLLCFINLVPKNNEGFGKMMQGKGKTGSVLSVPALCGDRTVEYCETTDGCKWNGSECNLKKRVDDWLSRNDTIICPTSL